MTDVSEVIFDASYVANLPGLFGSVAVTVTFEAGLLKVEESNMGTTNSPFESVVGLFMPPEDVEYQPPAAPTSPPGGSKYKSVCPALPL